MRCTSVCYLPKMSNLSLFGFGMTGVGPENEFLSENPGNKPFINEESLYLRCQKVMKVSGNKFFQECSNRRRESLLICVFASQ